MELANRIALITGANTGIGRVIASRLCRAGAKVYVNYLRDQGEMDSLIGELVDAPGEIHGLQADLRVDAERRSMFDTVAREEGHLDILINNAAVMHKGFLLALPDRDWWDSIDTNLTAIYASCCLARPLMAGSGQGRILNIGSVLARTSSLQQIAYCTTKAALEGILRGLRAELEGSGVLINTLAPGFVSTGIYASRWAGPSAVVEHLGADRAVDPETIASAALFLCSSENTWIDGQTVYLDSGWDPSRPQAWGRERAPGLAGAS